jgi:hypothetical protein
MKVVYKYTLPSYAGQHLISLPQEAEILSVQEQFGMLTLWVLTTTEVSLWDNRKFHVIETGGVVPDWCKLTYIDTCQLAEGTLVWHIFEEVME